MKEQVITIPNNFEIKEIKDGKIVLVEKKNKLTYEDVVKELFSKNYFIIGGRGEILNDICRLNNKVTDLTNCTSEKQAQKLLAINKLMNVAKYLNNGWQPDWNDISEAKYCITIEDDEIKIEFTWTECYLDIHFKSEELAKQAIEILGEETIKLALSTDY